MRNQTYKVADEVLLQKLALWPSSCQFLDQVDSLSDFIKQTDFAYLVNGSQ